MNAAKCRVQLAGTFYSAGGAIWFLLIVGATVVHIPFDQPQIAAFYGAEVLFVILQSLLLAGFFGIWWSGGVGRGTFGKIAFGLAVLGHIYSCWLNYPLCFPWSPWFQPWAFC